MTPDQLKAAALLWARKYDTGQIARTLRLDESDIWNSLSALRSLMATARGAASRHNGRPHGRA